MKKFYNEPEMNISMFEVENVVTSSGDVDPTVTAKENAKTALTETYGVASGNVVTFTW